MNRDKFNSKLREYVKTELSPTTLERSLITNIYDSFYVLFDHSCIQIGSYSRFTAIKPIHDLDIVYIIGDWDENRHSPTETLQRLYSKINIEYQNPTTYELTTSMQTHSITVVFKQGDQEILSVDIVPAYVFSKNEFGDDKYKIPEIIRQRHGKNRTDYYKSLAEQGQEIGWILSDPRGYIEVARRVNLANNDFRKTVKFIKAWKYACEAKSSEFKLKSFHIEQIVTAQFQERSGFDIFGSIFNFFVSLPNNIQKAQIRDMADENIFIDDYINELTIGQKERIIKARDGFLKRLEEFSEGDSVAQLLSAVYYQRAGHSEQYLFDFNIPIFLDDKYTFDIVGEVQERKGGFRKYILDHAGVIAVDRRINFRIKGTPPIVDSFKWKVKNDDSSEEPRGEITDRQTRNDPEHTKYKGSHFVECFAILNNVCVARARQNVVL